MIPSEPTQIRMNGVIVNLFQGESFVCGAPPPDRRFTRSAASGEAALSQPFQAKRVQTRGRRLAKPKQQAVFVGEANRIDGGKVDPKLKNRNPKLRKPKRQFSKKRKAPSSSPRPPAVRMVLPVPSAALSSRGRLIRKTAQFDPSVQQSTIKSVSRRRKDGLYVVSMLMTEEEVVQQGGGRFLKK